MAGRKKAYSALVKQNLRELKALAEQLEDFKLFKALCDKDLAESQTIEALWDTYRGSFMAGNALYDVALRLRRRAGMTQGALADAAGSACSPCAHTSRGNACPTTSRGLPWPGHLACPRRF